MSREVFVISGVRTAVGDLKDIGPTELSEQVEREALKCIAPVATMRWRQRALGVAKASRQSSSAVEPAVLCMPTPNTTSTFSRRHLCRRTGGMTLA